MFWSDFRIERQIYGLQTGGNMQQRNRVCENAKHEIICSLNVSKMATPIAFPLVHSWKY